MPDRPARAVRRCGSLVVTRPDDWIVPDYVAWLHDQGLPVSAAPEDRSCGYGNAAPILTLAGHLTKVEMFLIAFGDDVLLEEAPGATLAAMSVLAQEADATIAAQLIDHDQIGSFGAIKVTAPGGNRIAGIRQRPEPATVIEPLAVVSRLVLRPPILKQLTARPEAHGESTSVWPSTTWPELVTCVCTGWREDGSPLVNPAATPTLCGAGTTTRARPENHPHAD